MFMKSSIVRGQNPVSHQLRALRISGSRRKSYSFRINCASACVGFLAMVSSVLALSERMPIFRRVSSRRVEFELALDVAEHAAGADTEQVRLHPAIPQLFFHQRQPLDRLLRSADTARRL